LKHLFVLLNPTSLQIQSKNPLNLLILVPQFVLWGFVDLESSSFFIFCQAHTQFLILSVPQPFLFVLPQFCPVTWLTIWNLLKNNEVTMDPKKHPTCLVFGNTVDSFPSTSPGVESDRIIVRTCYKNLADIILSYLTPYWEHKQAFIRWNMNPVPPKRRPPAPLRMSLSGTPGIGKSAFLTYFLFLLWQVCYLHLSSLPVLSILSSTG
jgi:hypothetical protein